MPTPSILSVSSQVAYGHVGNAAIVPALQALGCEVLAVPTVLLAHHPGHGTPQGHAIPAQDVAGLLQGIEKVGALAQCSAVLTGYLGLAETAAVVADAVERLRRAQPAVLYLCDPVIGDDGRVYVREGVEDAIRDRLLPLADAITPNHFELERLSGRPVATLEQAMSAARGLVARGPRIVVVTSLNHDRLAPGQIATLAVTAGEAWIAVTPRLQRVPRGSGDLLAALLLGHLTLGTSLADALAGAASAVHAVLAASVGQPEMVLVEQRGQLAAPPVLQVQRIDAA